MIDHILLSGFSRIPVHEVGSPQSFMGMLLVKKVRVVALPYFMHTLGGGRPRRKEES